MKWKAYHLLQIFWEANFTSSFGVRIPPSNRATRLNRGGFSIYHCWALSMVPVGIFGFSWHLKALEVVSKASLAWFQCHWGHKSDREWQSSSVVIMLPNISLFVFSFYVLMILLFSFYFYFTLSHLAPPKNQCHWERETKPIQNPFLYQKPIPRDFHPEPFE